jgi:hypothetical protein
MRVNSATVAVMAVIMLIVAVPMFMSGNRPLVRVLDGGAQQPHSVMTVTAPLPECDQRNRFGERLRRALVRG